MYHGVGITADGTGEVGVVFKRQTIVADVVDAVFRLHHGAQGHLLNQVLLTFAVAVVHEFVEASCRFSLGAVGLQLVAELHDKFSQRFQFGGVGHIVDAVGQRLGFLAFGHTANALGHGTVGQQHELLHQFVGILRLLEVAADRFARLIDIKMQLFAVELHGTILEACLAQAFGQTVEHGQF